MGLHEYHLSSTWRIKGGIQEVCQILGNTSRWTQWWSTAFSEVTELQAGDRYGQGSVFKIISHGFLPYRLHWEVQMREVDYPGRVYFTVSGDFAGRGLWNLQQEGDEVLMVFDWKVRTEKALLKRLGFLLKPLFTLNHRWAMRKGRQSLQGEVDRCSQTGTVLGRSNDLYTGPLQLVFA